MSPGVQGCLGRRMGLLRPKVGKADSRFLLYAYLAPDFQEVIRQRSIHGATVERIPLVDLPDWPIRIAPLPEQIAIGNLLGALDDKIGVNELVISNASTLLRAHFSAGMQGITREVKLGDLIDLRYGKALRETDRTPGKVPVFGGNGISGWHNIALAQGPGIIIGRKGANAGSVSWSQGPYWAIDTSFYVEPLSSRVPQEFLYFLLRSAGLRNLVGDSAIPGLNRDVALGRDVELPSNDFILRFSAAAESLLALSAQIGDESRALKELRDALLPELVSGQIRVRDAVKVFEGVR